MFIHNSGNSSLVDVDCSFAGCTLSSLLHIALFCKASEQIELQEFNRPIILSMKYTKACENRSKSVMQEHVV